MTSKAAKPQDVQLDRAGVAAMLGIKADSVSRMLADTSYGGGRYRNFPMPDGRIGRSPWWWASTIDAWRKTRPGMGVGGGRPRRDES